MDYYDTSSVGVSPVTLSVMKSYMKVTSTTDDVLIQSLINACTEHGESYTGREFRANTWVLLIDTFSDRIALCRNPIDTITSVEHLVSNVLVTVPSADYYKKDLTQLSELLLLSGKAWPTDTDDREHAVKIIFVTKAYRKIETIKNGILRHTQFMYRNRGDCLETGDAGKISGANAIYDTMRISRI